MEYGGGVDTKDGGFYIEPTVISGVDPQARISQEEIFRTSPGSHQVR